MKKTLKKWGWVYGLGMLMVCLTLSPKAFSKERLCCHERESDHFYWRYPKELESEISNALQKLEKVYQDLTQVISNTGLPKRWVVFQGTNRGNWRPVDHSRLITYPQKARPVFEILFLRNWQDYLFYFQLFRSLDPLDFQKEKNLWKGKKEKGDPLLLGLSLYLEERLSYDSSLWISLRKLALRQIPPHATFHWRRLPDIFPFNPQLGHALVVASFWFDLESHFTPEALDQFLKQRDKPWQKAFEETFKLPFEKAWKNFVARRYQGAFRGEPEGIAQPETVPNQLKGGLGLKVSPDSEWLAFLTRSYPHNPLFPKVVHLKNNRERVYRKLKQDAHNISWLEDSEGLITEKYFRSPHGLMASTPRLLVLKKKAHDLFLPSKARCGTYWKVNNRIVFVDEEGGVENLYWMALGKANVLGKMTSNESPRLHFSCPVILEKMNGLIFSLLDERGLETFIYYDFYSGGLAKLFLMPGHQIHPSPVYLDQLYLLSSAEVEGRFAIYAYSIGKNQLFLLARGDKDLFFPTATKSGDLFAMSLAKGEWRLEYFKVPSTLAMRETSPYSSAIFPQLEPSPETSPPQPSPAPETDSEIKIKVNRIQFIPPSLHTGLWLEPVDQGGILGARSQWDIGSHRLSFQGGWETHAQAPQGKFYYRYHGFSPYLEVQVQEQEEFINATGEFFSSALFKTGILTPLFQERGGLGIGYAFNGMRRLGGGFRDRFWFSGPYLSFHIPMDPPTQRSFFRNTFTTELDGFYWMDTFEGTEPFHPEISLRSGGQVLFKRIGFAAGVEAGYLQDIPITRRSFEVGGEKRASYLFNSPSFLIRGYPFQSERTLRPLVTHGEIRYYLGKPVSESFLDFQLEGVTLAGFADVGTNDFTQNATWKIHTGFDWRIGTGFEARLHGLVFHQWPILLRLGVHQGLHRGGRRHFFVGISQLFF